MRYLVISDVHGNLTALETVLDATGEVDAVWCLGDVVGYGPDPNECLERIRGLPGLVCILGNHDSAVLFQNEAETFNPEARVSIEWTMETLTKKNKKFIAEFSKRATVDNVTLVHGSPRNPTFEYMLDRYTATINFGFFDSAFCFFGHTHVPTFFHLDKSLAGFYIPEGEALGELEPRMMVNPGSVGQPRDRDPRASFAVYDSEKQTWHYQRVEYDIKSVQKRMKSKNLPQKHIERLGEGW